MKRDVSIYIKDIFKNRERAEKFVQDMSDEDFAKDKKTNYVVIRCIEIMGEAAKYITESGRQRYSEIPGGRLIK